MRPKQSFLRYSARMNRYQIISKGPAKLFSITCGLREGYEPDSKIHTSSEVSDVIKYWIKHRKELGLQYLTGIAAEAEVIYLERQGYAGGEAVVTFSGQVSPEVGDRLSDEEIISMLNDLASRIGEATKQEQIHLVYRGTAWILGLPRS